MVVSQHIFSLTRKDFRMEFFRAGGSGGQNQNKVSSACRITHIASGAVGESREERDQHRNRAIAFKRLSESKTFRAWIRVEASARLKGFADAEALVNADMAPENLKIETFDPEAK